MNTNRQLAACVFDLILLLQFHIKCKRLPIALKALEGETTCQQKVNGLSRIAETPKYVKSSLGRAGSGNVERLVAYRQFTKKKFYE